MEKSWQIFGDYGVYETEKEQGLFPRLERALQKPDKVENCRVIVPSAPLRQLSIVIGNKELSEKRLTLNNTPFNKPRFLGDGCVLARGVGVAQHREHLLALALVVARMRAAEGAAEDAIVDEDGAHVAVQPWHANDNDVLALDGL